MAKFCVGALVVYHSHASLNEDVDGLGLLQVQAGKKHNGDPVHEWGFTTDEAGWYDSGPETNCETACGAHGLICTEEAMFAHFEDVDTNEKVLNLIHAVGGATSDENCQPLAFAPMPAWKADKCFRGKGPRLITEERCTAIPGPRGQGKHRLCYCHPEVPVTTTNPPRRCCRAFTPECLSCAAGLTIEEWCEENENSPVADMCPEAAVLPALPNAGTCEPCSILHGKECTHPGNADAAWCVNNCLLAHQSDEACGVNGQTGTHCVCAAAPTTAAPTTAAPTTAAPTTAAPTTEAPVATTTEADDVEAVEDPHMSSIHGNKFDLFQPGHHVLLSVPRGSTEQNAQLLVSAEIEKIGVRENDLWIRKLDVRGSWVGDHLTFATVDGEFNAADTQRVQKGDSPYATAELVAQQHPTLEVLPDHQGLIAPSQEFEHTFTKRMRLHMGPVVAKIKFGTAFKNGQQINHLDFRADGLTAIKEDIGGELADEVNTASLFAFNE